MKNLFFSIAVLSVLAFGAVSASAQCDRNTASPIRCGFYDEGYQDGVSDANSNRSDDYRRYRSKYVAQYESFYRDGYSAGYDSVRPTVRWTASQRAAYNSGYTLGQSDRRRGGGEGSAQGGRSYDPNIGLYFQQGYTDGFDNRARRYDFQIEGTPTFPGPGTGTTGTASWGGRVDDRANIIIRGNTIRSEDVSATGLQVAYQNMNGSLPRRGRVDVSARKTSGRGEVFVIQQPSRGNDWTAIIQVVDTRAGAGDYRIDISWGGGGSGSNVEETYRPGSVRWRGRVDQTVNIVISGVDVETQDAAGTGVSNVDFNLTGSLARRPGSVTASKRFGRGTVRVIQQPSRDNDYMAIVQIFDPGSGADDYEVDIRW